jgi:ammonium transporter, Amt family
VRAAGIDDAVGAFAVHGACGMLGSLSIGLLGLEGLTDGAGAGLLMGGGFGLLSAQILGVVSVLAWTSVTGFIMFGALKALGILRIPDKAEVIGIDSYEHGASTWPDILPPTLDSPDEGGAPSATAPATGD